MYQQAPSSNHNPHSLRSNPIVNLNCSLKPILDPVPDLCEDQPKCPDYVG